MTDDHSPIRTRTERAILDAGAVVLGQDPAATLGAVASAAGVSRSTLHRYFPDRDGLLGALVDDGLRAVGEGVAHAAPERGDPTDALARVIAGLVACGDQISFLFTHNYLYEDHPAITGFDHAQSPIRAAIERGRQHGQFAPEFGDDWIERALWSIAYAAIRGVQEGSLPRHLAAEHATRLLLRGIGT